MGQRRLGLILAVLACDLGALAGCSASSINKQPPPPEQLVKAAFDDFDQQTSYRISGSLYAGGHVLLDFTVVSPDMVQGTVRDSVFTGALVASGGDIYVQGTISVLGAPLNKFLAGKWVTNSTKGPNFAIATSWAQVRKLWTRRDLEDAFQRGLIGMTSKSTSVNGINAVLLQTEQESLYVSRDPKPRLLKILRPAGAPSQDGFTEVALTFSDYSAVSKVDPPTGAVDLGDRNQLPALYAEQPNTSHFITCDLKSCGEAVTLINRNGNIAADPPPTITFDFKRDDGTAIDSCTAPVPLVPHGATVDVSCSASGSGWRSFALTGAAFDGSLKVANPVYDAASNPATA